MPLMILIVALIAGSPLAINKMEKRNQENVQQFKRDAEVERNIKMDHKYNIPVLSDVKGD